MRSFLLTACGQKNNDDVVIDYGSSEIYTKEDMDDYSDFHSPVEGGEGWEPDYE